MRVPRSEAPPSCGCRGDSCALGGAPTWSGQLSDMVVLFDDQRRFHHANPAAERLLGLAQAELAGHTVTELSTDGAGFLRVNRQVAVAVDEAVGRGVQGGSVRDDEAAVVLADGSAGVLAWSLGPIHHDGRVVGATLIMRDMTALSNATFQTAPVGMVRVGPGGEVRAVNHAFQAMLGRGTESILDRPLRELLHPGDIVEADRLFAELIDGGRDRYEVEHRFRRSDGAVVWCRVTMTVPRRREPGDPSTNHHRAIGVVQDITERRRLAAAVSAHAVQLEQLSRTDPLTGLSNRRHLEERLTELAAMMRRRHGELAVLMIDLDRFRDINDAHGHGVGDQVLRTVSQRLRGYSRADDVVGRWGGEEFLVVCPFTGLDGVRVLGERLRACIGSTPVELPGGNLVPVTASVGAACGTADGIARLLQRADDAVHEAKAAGRNRFVSAGPTFG